MPEIHAPGYVEIRVAAEAYRHAGYKGGQDADGNVHRPQRADASFTCCAPVVRKHAFLAGRGATRGPGFRPPSLSLRIERQGSEAPNFGEVRAKIFRRAEAPVLCAPCYSAATNAAVIVSIAPINAQSMGIYAVIEAMLITSIRMKWPKFAGYC